MKEEKRIKMKSNCDDCMNYIYDEETDCYICLVDLDQDEMEHFLNYATSHCPYFRFCDDYSLARKQ